MKKKLLTTVLATAMVLSTIGCGEAKPEEPIEEVVVENQIMGPMPSELEELTPEEQQAWDEATNVVQGEVIDAGNEPAAPVEDHDGQVDADMAVEPETDVEDVEVETQNWVGIFSDYITTVSADYDGTVESLTGYVDGLAEACNIPLGLVAMEVEEGCLAGFDNFEVKGFDTAVQFGPMIGSIPFVGYIFDLSDGTDPEAFMTDLEANANLRWNICTEAEETSFFAVNDLVFFAMHPSTFETE